MLGKLSSIYKEWEPIRDKLSNHRQGIKSKPEDIRISVDLFKKIFRELEDFSGNRNYVYLFMQFQLIEDLTQSKGRRFTPINKIHKTLLQRYVHKLVNFIDHDLNYILQDDHVFDLLLGSHANYFLSTNIEFSSCISKDLFEKSTIVNKIESSINFDKKNLVLFMKILKEFDYYFLYDDDINEHAWNALPTWIFFKAIEDCSLSFCLLPSRRFEKIYIDVKTELEEYTEE